MEWLFGTCGHLDEGTDTGANNKFIFYLGMKIQDTWSANTHTPLTTPTYDASGEATHPGVYDAGTGQTWNGYRYWMVMTPYPNSDATKENPSILASADGTTWVVPAGLTNPIASPNPVQCSDPDIVVVSGTMSVSYTHLTLPTTPYV